MGRVYVAHSPKYGRVALKLLDSRLDDGTYRRRLAHEVALAQRVDSRNIAAVLDADLDAPEPWVAMEYVDGPTLAERVASAGPLAPGVVLGVIRQTAQALADIHAVDIVHRDLKPSNIICGADGVVRVTDFGIATATDLTELTATGQRVGTLAYTAPEQFQGEAATTASDVFALGAVTYFAATGRSLFGGGPDSEVIGRILSGRHRSQGAADRRVNDLIDACLRQDPRLRPLAVGVVEHCARTLTAEHKTPGEPAEVTVTRQSTQAAGRTRARRWPAFVITVGIMALVAGASTAAWFLTRPSPQPPSLPAAPERCPHGDRVRIDWTLPVRDTPVEGRVAVDEAPPPAPCPERVTADGSCTFIGAHDTSYRISLLSSQQDGQMPDPVTVRTFAAPQVSVRAGDKVTDAGQSGCVVLIDASGLHPDHRYTVNWTTDAWEAQGRRPQSVVLDRRTDGRGVVSSAALHENADGNATELAYRQPTGGWVRVQVDDLPAAVKKPWECP